MMASFLSKFSSLTFMGWTFASFVNDTWLAMWHTHLFHTHSACTVQQKLNLSPHVLDWPGFGLVWVQGSQAWTWTCTLRFGSRTCQTWTHTKCSGSECSVRVHTMFEVKKSLNLANLSTTHRYYESKFILDSFLFWVFPARFLRWLAANVNLFTWSHDFLLLKLWKGRTSSKCPSCHPAQPVPKSFYIL